MTRHDVKIKTSVMHKRWADYYVEYKEALRKNIYESSLTSTLQKYRVCFHRGRPAVRSAACFVFEVLWIWHQHNGNQHQVALEARPFTSQRFKPPYILHGIPEISGFLWLT